jgi:hypothetical protein
MMCHDSETAKLRRQRAAVGASALSAFAIASDDGDSPFEAEFKEYTVSN